MPDIEPKQGGSIRQIWPGKPYPRGATFQATGVNFAVFSRVATRVEVCLFDPAEAARGVSKEIDRFDLPEVSGFTWHGFVPGLPAGTLYGLRVHGPYAPEQGHRCNPHKLLVDPYAKALWGKVDWKAPVFGYKVGGDQGDLIMEQSDSAAGIPRSVVVDDSFDWEADQPPDTTWRETVIYEVHVRGFTQLHPEIPAELRGTYAGLAHPAAIGHLKGLGITAVELLPVHAFTDDGFLQDRSLSNYWGYSTLGFFAPEQRYASQKAPGGQVREFKAMVKALHAAGIEVILDVVFNHTCEGNHLGPTLSFRGIDNASYYWLMPEARYYLDFTGTGNSINASNPEAARLIVDSLRYWVRDLHVDGFRFDLASTLGRVGRGAFDRHAPIFQIINQDPVLSRVKLIAEPWDCGLGGYQVGNFPAPFREWNGKFRDAIRRYWKGDSNLATELGYRLSGSADLFQGERRQPQASVNFVTAHDGFTLHDLVTYGSKHNQANGEGNQDGADDNQSWNHGAEGETDDPEIVALRERQKRNLLATMFLSQGVPMLLGGDEMGRTQRGNNNAYCQDNEISWFDWKLDDRRRSLMEFTRRLIKLRQRHPVLQRRRFLMGDFVWESQAKDVAWLRPDGEEMAPEDWRRPGLGALGFMLGGDAIPTVNERGERLVDDSVLVFLNAYHEATKFHIPTFEAAGKWLLEVDTGNSGKAPDSAVSGDYELSPRSMVVLRQPLDIRVKLEAGAARTRALQKEAQRRRRRAGVLMPLFSIRSETGWGLGEITDLPKFASWASQSGFSVLQLLPVNQVSRIDPSPYAAVSAFALDAAYLSLDACPDFQAAGGRQALPDAAKKGLDEVRASRLVNWTTVRSVKRAGIELAFAHFLREEWGKKSARASELASFMRESRNWLDDYALFAVWHEEYDRSWLDWPVGARDRDPQTIAEARASHADDLLRINWVQWQLDEQWRQARREASRVGVELMGDLPFMVGVDSADVWANRELFALDKHVGTPPDAGSPAGQDWGLPVYDWWAMQRDDFSWIRARAMRSGALFSLYRADHAIGFYRTYFRTADGKDTGYTPPDEVSQVRLGETIMRLMSHWGEVVAEDLGAVPPFLRESLGRLGVPGYRVLRWELDGDEFRDPETWPDVSVATNATHDTETTAEWYDALEPTRRAKLLGLVAKRLGTTELDPAKPFDERVRDALLRLVYAAPSNLSIIPFQDAIGGRDRINTPGTQDPANWSTRSEKSVDELLSDRETMERLARMAAESGRTR
jgi:glycogen operon protein